MKKSISKVLCLIMLLVIAISFAPSIKSLAFDNDKVTARKEANDSAEAVATFSAGDSIFVVSEENGWYKIYYKGEYAYVNTSFDAAAQEEVEELKQEFQQKEQIDITYVESYQKQLKRAKNALIWKIVIGGLVAAIIVVSVVVGIKNSKASGQENQKE